MILKPKKMRNALFISKEIDRAETCGLINEANELKRLFHEINQKEIMEQQIRECIDKRDVGNLRLALENAKTLGKKIQF
jgi:hypothetical protein